MARTSHAPLRPLRCGRLQVAAWSPGSPCAIACMPVLLLVLRKCEARVPCGDVGACGRLTSRRCLRIVQARKGERAARMHSCTSFGVSQRPVAVRRHAHVRGGAHVHVRGVGPAANASRAAGIESARATYTRPAPRKKANMQKAEQLVCSGSQSKTSSRSSKLTRSVSGSVFPAPS